jgi:integrase
VPADLRPILGVNELVRSLRTPDLMQAVIGAGRLALVVGDIQRARQAFFAGVLALDEFEATAKHHWRRLDSMAQQKKKSKPVRTGLIMWTGSDGSKLEIKRDCHLEEAAIARELGLLPPPLQAEELKQPDGDTNSPLLTEVFKDFLTHKTSVKEAAKEGRKPLSAKQVKEHERHLDKLVAIMGDRPIAKITRRDLKDAILTCAGLPQMNKKPYKGAPISELLEMDIPEEDRASSKSVLGIKKSAQGLFSFAVEKGILEVSPARDLKLKMSTGRTFAAFADAEVRKILAASLTESESWKKWLPPLAAYTGARRGELVQLRKQDVKLDPESGRHYLLTTEDAGAVKSENATRQIPVHVELVKMGFLEFVNSTDERLFGGLDPQAVTKWFTGFRDRLDIARFDDFGNRKVWHSLRHSFITKARGAGNPLEHVQQVVGHERISAGVTDRYSHRLPLGVVLGVVDCIDYSH